MNTIYKRFSASSYYLLLFCFFSIFSACKKEYEDFPYADIVSFTVKDANGEPVKAVIDDKNLTIYWPSGQTVPDHITPAIVVSERASVSPASGQSVAFKETTKFVVTAQNGTTKAYLIKMVINQPLLKINISSGVLVYNTKNFVNRGSNINVTGDNIIASKEQTKAFLVNTANSTEKEVAIAAISPIALSVTVDNTVPDGIYQLKIVSGLRSVVLERSFGVANGRPTITPVELSAIKLTLKLGEEFVLTGANRIELINKFSIRNAANKQIYDLMIKETKTGQLILKVPDNLPTGNYDLYSYDYPAGEYYAAGRISDYFDDMITITN
ncbi:hypothetical protein SAMN04488511_101458 [Pedobacter suwonensis]|uniref:DUF5018 domain-containing protein n=1 Tax=Pedobacter suwonensis TaxID=332999 RepID=A0A1I0SJB1_9SPHI|nr:hypothetical protein [Pedobacter suwonensis]SFA39507.1 hypothetical protein SAMN04488511_101458 [Pedobacter suwonensis]